MFVVKLLSYFGVLGVCSILVWMGSLGMLLAYARSLRRTSFYWKALGVALLGLILASLNSGVINRFERDQDAEIQAGRARGEAIGNAEAGVSLFGDVAGGDEAVGSGEPKEYSYREKGKVDREGGKVLDDSAAGVALAADQKGKVRRLRPEAMIEANQYDRINLFFARTTFWLALLFVGGDYVRRLNTTFNCYFPLPLSSRLLDMVSPKTLSVAVAADRLIALKTFLGNAVRKGETFIYFGATDPWPSETLPRLVLRWLAFWPLRKVVCRQGQMPFPVHYVFESAWFKRYAFVVEGQAFSNELLKGLEAFLADRHTVRAVARQTINIVWACEQPIAPVQRDELLFLCRETNHKLIIVTPPAQAGQFDSIVEEVYPAPAAVGS